MIQRESTRAQAIGTKTHYSLAGTNLCKTNDCKEKCFYSSEAMWLWLKTMMACYLSPNEYSCNYRLVST